MDLKALKYFAAVYENGSFSAAAAQCFVAQPSVSAAISQLESQLNCKLFVRHARGVKSTAQGDTLYQHAVTLLGQAKAISGLFNEKSQNQAFSLGLIRSLGVDRMSRLLKDFAIAVPQLELSLVSPEDNADARIINKRLLKDNETFVPIWQDDYALAVPISHALALKPYITLDDLEALALIERSPCSAWSLLVKYLNQQKIKPRTVAHIQTIEYAIGLVRAEVGCAILPNIEQINQYEDVVFKPIASFALKREIGLAYFDNNTNNTTLQQLINVCQSR
ncbi:LysR family transcriptional regulator [Glaciecola petra]|uniref:LysR family transcriptional regulator n=1 Tax=Glaciecola petra TaxID=3075602 RepID=A0ABU2ZQM3_9ALTE|nr:LysR family transcriptional regulator [Aestuariibacter sp. P117]MDT0594566.1 LysR family transcriptional regulator [Aestuariibacter sp. P117]